MKKFEPLVGILFGLAFASLAFLAIFVLGALVMRGPAQHSAPLSAPGSAALGSAAPDAAVGMAANAVGDGAATTAVPATAPATVEVTPAAVGVDAAAGEKVFKACKACHANSKDGKAGTGPNLWDVVGRPIATFAGFKYSADLSAMSGESWDAAKLDSFLTSPKAFVKGTKMGFAGLKKPEDRANVIAWLASQSDTPQTPEALGLVAAAGAAPAADAPAADTNAAAADVAAADVAAADTATDTAAGPFDDLADDAVVEIAPVPYPEGVVYADVPARTDAEIARIGAALDALRAEIPTLDYQRARYNPMHFQPAIATASSEECLACHKEILDHTPRATAPAGVSAAQSTAWYETLDTYDGAQADFHWRHIESPFARKVMKLECNFCHKGNDPREESPDMMPGRAAFSASATPEFTLRKMVNPSETCLLCHGQMPDPENIMGLPGHWPEARVDMETAEAPNGCLTCHAETFRTNRHQVNYLNAAAIEDLARKGTSDTCYGCHGGRAWYRIPYPYTRHPWPGMDTETVPDWAANRPTETAPEHALAPAAE